MSVLCEELFDPRQWDLAYESRAWLEAELYLNEYDWMCGVKLNERKKVNSKTTLGIGTSQLDDQKE